MTWLKSKTLKASIPVCFVDASESLQLPSNVNISMPYTCEHSEALTVDKVYSSITVDQVSGKDELKGGISYESTTYWFLANVDLYCRETKPKLVNYSTTCSETCERTPLSSTNEHLPPVEFSGIQHDGHIEGVLVVSDQKA